MDKLIGWLWILFWVGLFGGCLVNMWMVWIDCLDNWRVSETVRWDCGWRYTPFLFFWLLVFYFFVDLCCLAVQYRLYVQAGYLPPWLFILD